MFVSLKFELKVQITHGAVKDSHLSPCHSGPYKTEGKASVDLCHIMSKPYYEEDVLSSHLLLAAFLSNLFG